MMREWQQGPLHLLSKGPLQPRFQSQSKSRLKCLSQSRSKSPQPRPPQAQAQPRINSLKRPMSTPGTKSIPLGPELNGTVAPRRTGPMMTGPSNKGWQRTKSLPSTGPMWRAPVERRLKGRKRSGNLTILHPSTNGTSTCWRKTRNWPSKWLSGTPRRLPGC
jgi:hypothetical protein